MTQPTTDQAVEERRRRVFDQIAKDINVRVFRDDEVLIWNLIAHELAEQQRAAIRKTDDPVFYDGEAGWLPNLIDPAETS